MSSPANPLSGAIPDSDSMAALQALPTEHDLPYDDGEPMESARHRDQMVLLIESLRAHWTDRTDYYVGGNMFVHYDPEDKRHCRGPDFFLVLDVDDRERRSWVVWQEGMRYPDVIIELLSDTTRNEDTGAKKALYESEFGTPEYYLYDPFSREFLAYHLRAGAYRAVPPDADGSVYSPLAHLRLGVRDGWLRWLTEAGVLVPTPRELAEQEHQRAEQERQLAEQERQLAEQERQRADRERQLAGQERQRAEQERELAEQERQRADRERQRAEQAEQMIAAYQARFGNLEDS